jgi:transcriptional regulator with XRE-family HTH domain
MVKNFRKNLRDELDYQNITVKQLSIKASTAKGALDSYLGKQESMPPADTAVKIANALGVTVEYLITGKDTNVDKRRTIFSPAIRAILQILNGMNDDDINFILEITKLVKNKSKLQFVE